MKQPYAPDIMFHILPKPIIAFFTIFFLVIFSSVCFSSSLEKKVIETQTIKNLQNELLIYDEGARNYIPFIPNTKFDFPTVSYYLDLNIYAGYKLRHCLPSGSSLFIDHQIVDFTNHRTCTLYGIDSLRKIYQKDTLFITIYNASIAKKGLEISVVSEVSPVLIPNEKADTDLRLVSRTFSGFPDFFIVGLLLIMALIAVLCNSYSKNFQDFYNLSKALTLKIREESYISVKNISGTYFLFLLVHSFLLGFIVLTMAHFYEGMEELFVFIRKDEFWAASFSWLQVSLFIFALLLAKYVLVKSISELFNIKGFSTIHFFDFLRMSIFFFLLVLITLCILLFGFSFEEGFWFRPLLISIIIFFIFRIIVLYLKLYKYAPFRNLHLFLYICSTELLPLMVGIKIFMD